MLTKPTGVHVLKSYHVCWSLLGERFCGERRSSDAAPQPVVVRFPTERGACHDASQARLGGAP